MRSIQTRMTRQRAIILEEISKVCSHPTADEIYAMVRLRLPRISLGTVYRNLDLLTENGQIQKLEGYIRRFDANTMPHSHVKCMTCGKIADAEHVDISKFLPTSIDVSGFVVQNARVEFDGYCRECYEKEMHS